MFRESGGERKWCGEKVVWRESGVEKWKYVVALP
jgi:hypothetical protein